MEKTKIDMFLGMNAEKFFPQDLAVIRERLEQLDDDKLYLVTSATLWSPTTILLIAIFLGWERFFLDDIALGVIKIITCYGCGIWWLIDLFTAQDRAKRYNFNKVMQALAYV
jgi:hypothetical protein